LFTGLPNRFFDGNDRTSQVPGGPHSERALLFDPGGTSALGHYRASMLPSAQRTASAPTTMLISGLNHTARPFAVYASQSGLLHRHARLASGWLANLSGRGLLPAGSQRKVSDHLILLSQASPGAPFAELKGEFALDVVPTNHYGANSAWLQLCDSTGQGYFMYNSAERGVFGGNCVFSVGDGCSTSGCPPGEYSGVTVQNNTITGPSSVLWISTSYGGATQSNNSFTNGGALNQQ
jgi:hypothetical protein